MQTKNQVSLTRKTLNVIMLLGLIFSAFGAGSLPSVQAQENAAKFLEVLNPLPPNNQELEQMLINDLNSNGTAIPNGYRLLVDHGDAQNDWIVITYYYLSDNNDVSGESLGIGHFENGDWKGITNVNPIFNSWLSSVPTSLLSDDLKQFFIVNPMDVTAENTYSGHKLPWQGGASHQVTTAVGGHSNSVEYWAYDFAMPNGTELWASMGGRVAYVTQSFGPGGCDASYANLGNRVVVNNDDGSASLYLHLQQNGAKVSVGQRVETGDLIGLSGNSGWSCGSGGGYHLHFQVQTQGGSWWTQSHQVIFTPNGELVRGTSPVSGNYRGSSGSACSGPSLSNPGDGYISTSQTVNFSWSAVSGCTFNGYTFRIKDTSNMDSGGNTIVDTGVGNTSRTETIASQWNNKNLYWGVKAANAPNGASWTVRRFVIQPGSAPSTPSNPGPSDYSTLSRTNNTNLTWSTNGTNCTVHIWGGSIDISPSGGCSNLALGSQRGGAYSWQVNASNSYGNSAGPTWHFNVKPYGSSGLSPSVASSSQINLIWTLSSDDDGTNVDGYDVYKNGQLVGSVNKGVNTYQAAGLVCNTGYSFYVLSKRQGVQSDASNTVTATTSACGPASPTLNSPANNAILARTTSIVLSWNIASGANQYRAHFWGGPNIDVWTSWTSGTSTTLGSQWGGVYQWSVEASNGSVSSFSETRNLTVLYGTPTNLSATVVSPTQINLAWNASADAPGNLDGYRIYRNGSEVATVGSSTTTYQDTGLACGTAYSYTVMAFKGTLESSASNTASTSATNCPPVMPGNLTVNGETTSSLTLNWQDNSNNETGFNIYRWGYDGAQWTFIYLATVGANVTTYTQTGLACGSDFNYYEVSAYNANGESIHAGWVQGTTVACPKSELSIASITFDPVSPFTNDDVWMIVAIQNNSNVAASGFWIDYYVDNVPTGCSDWGSYWNRSNGLAANSTDEFWIRLPANRLTAGTHQFRAYIDSGCEITEADENNNISTAAFTLTVPPVAPPAHDDFGSARLVSPIPYSNTVDVSGATTASDDPYVPDCEGVELAPGMTSVWYKYTPTANESLYLDTFGSSYDTYIAVWSGTRGNLSSIACNDDLIGHDRQSGLPVNLTAGTTYYFEIAQYSDSTPISSLSAASTTETDLRSSNTGTLVTKSAPNLKPTSDLEAQSAGGTLQFHVLPKSFAAVSLWTADFSYSPQGWRANLHPRMMGDVNGDGKDDVVGFGYGGILVGLSNGSGFNPATSWTTDFSYNQGWRMDTYPRMVGDVNGDGKADVVGFGYAGAVVALSNGVNGFAPLSLWTTDYSYNQGWRVDLHPRVLGDVNGDGKDDIIGFGYGGILVGLSNGHGFNPVISWTTDFSYNQGWRMDTYPRMVGDVNGDGKADVVGFGYAGAVVALSNGSGFDTLSLWTSDFSYYPQGWRANMHPRVLGDVNGDGKDDIIGFGYGGVVVALSNGSGFDPVTSWTTDFSYNQGWRMDTYPRMAGDVNGDGKDDAIGFGYSGVLVAVAK